MSDELWDIIEGRVPRPYSAGRKDGLVRALGWGNDARAPLQALIAKLHEVEDRINDATCPHCGQHPIFRKDDV
jgi:hypothetical protein